MTAVVGGLASLVAAGIGLGLKSMVAEARPCQLRPALAEWTTCPSDASFPSNHSVFAGSLAVTLAVVARLVGRWWITGMAVVVALAIATTRVVLGVHYWWDVAAGLPLGAAVAAAALATVAPQVTRALASHAARRSSSVG